jgi:glycerol-3-phosphate O-acyltransferase
MVHSCDAEERAIPPHPEGKREAMERQTADRQWRVRSQQELNLLTLQLVQALQRTYEPGRDRIITPENVYQPGREEGRAELEAFMEHVLAPGSAVEGAQHLDHCLAELEAGRSVLFLPEHRGNLDVPSFAVLLRRSYPRAAEIARRLIYIAGRKLNESSDLIKMFSEKYSRLVIVPRRDFPPDNPQASEAERQAREEFIQYAARINRAAFRELVRLKKAGHIFVLFPLGGRLKPDADNVPVRETASYLHSFDTVYPISMEGNTLPPLARMEDERPIQDKVVFRVGPPLASKAFLAAEKARFEAERAAGRLPAAADYEQVVVQRIMSLLEHLRLQGDTGLPGAG